MAEFHGFLLSLLPSVLLKERGGWGRVGSGKSLRLGHPMSSHDAHTVANDSSEPRSRWDQTQPNWCPPRGAVVPAVTLEGWENALTFNT